MDKVAIIILNWNSDVVTIDCLKSLLAINYSNYKIYLIDNGSKDSSSFIRANIASESIRYVDLKYNYGFSGGNNIGVEIATKEYDPDYFLLINNDTIADQYFLTQMVESFLKDDKVGIVVPKIFFYEPMDYIYYAGGYINLLSGLGEHNFWRQKDDPKKTNFPKKVTFANGCCLLISKQVINTVGLLDDDFFAFVEDVDYSYRTIRAGYDIMYNPKAVIWHREGFSSKKNQGQWFRLYLCTRNLILFQRKRNNFGSFILFIFYFVARWVVYMELKYLLKNDYKSCKAIFCGIIDGFSKKLRYVKKPEAYIFNKS